MPESGYGNWYLRNHPVLPTVGGLQYYWGAESYFSNYSSYTPLSPGDTWFPFIGAAGIFSWGGGPNPAFEPGAPYSEEDWRYWNLPSLEFTGASTFGSASPPTGLNLMYGFHLYLVVQRYNENNYFSPAPSSPLFSMWGSGATGGWTPDTGISGAGPMLGIEVFDNGGIQDFRLNSHPRGGGGTIASRSAGIPNDLPSNEIFLHEVYFDPASCNLYYKVDPLNGAPTLEPAALNFAACANSNAYEFASGMRIGSYSAPGTTGIHELLIYDHPLSQFDRDELWDYFHDKYDPTYYYY